MIKLSHTFTYLSLLVVFLLNIEQVYSKQNRVEEIEVNAYCQEHVELSTPESIAVYYKFNSNTSGNPTVDGLVALDETNQIPLSNFSWGETDERWFSLLFAGPPVQATYYCSDFGSTKGLNFTYTPQKNIKMYMSPKKEFSTNEISYLETDTKSNLRISPEQDKQNLYMAGEKTNNPYWLHISIPIHNNLPVATDIFFQFTE